MSRLAGLVAVALLALALLPVSGGALSVNEIAKEVRCPTCNTPLDVSDAPVARDMKQYIAVRIEPSVPSMRTAAPSSATTSTPLPAMVNSA